MNQDQDRQVGWAALPGQWLTVFRCQKDPKHLMYVEEWISGPMGESRNDPVWCPWGDEGTMERLAGEFEVVVTGAMRSSVRTEAR